MLRGYLQDNAVARRELEAVRSGQARRKWRYWLLAGGLLVGLPYALPFLPPTLTGITVLQGVPIQASPQYQFSGFVIGILLVAVLGANLFALFMMGLATTTSVRSMQTEFENGSWQSMILAGQSPARIVLGKWWGIVRGFAADFALASIFPILLTLTVATSLYLFLFNVDALGACQPLWGVLRPYCARDLFILAGGLPPGSPAFAVKLLTSASVGLAFGMAMLALATAGGLLAGTAAQRAKQNGLLLVWAARLALFITLAVGLSALASWKLNSNVVQAADNVAACQNPQNYDPSPYTYLDCGRVYQQHRILQISETAEVAAMTLVDGGTLLRGNLMQPIATRASLARNLIAALLGLAAYGLLTLAALRLAVRASGRTDAGK